MDEDSPPVLAVDWDAAGNEPPEIVKLAVEYYGTKHAAKYVEDDFPPAWEPGGEKWGVLTRIIDEHAQWNVPGHGPLNPTYADLVGTTGLQDALRAYRGDAGVLDRFPLLVPLDPALKTQATTPAAVPNAGVAVDFDRLSTTQAPEEHEYSFVNTDFGAELHRLVNAAAAIDAAAETIVDPVPDRDTITGEPELKAGQYGPDWLGNLYITVCLPDEASIEDLPIEDHPISIEDTRELDVVEGIDLTLRHERYTDIPWASEPWGERTHELFVDLRARSNFIEAASFYWVGDDLDAMVGDQTGLVPSETDVEFPPKSGETSPVYEPPIELEDQEGELRWLTLLMPGDSEKQPIGIFTESPPTSEMILQAAVLLDVQQSMRKGDAQAVYRCNSCDEWTHWMGTNGSTADADAVLDRLDYAHAQECGCEWGPQ